MLIVRIISDDPQQPIAREIDIIAEKTETVGGIKCDLEHVTGVKSEDQKLYKENDEKNQQQQELDDDEKTLEEYNLLTSTKASSSSLPATVLTLMTPSSSFEAMRAVSSVKEDEEKSQDPKEKETPEGC